MSNPDRDPNAPPPIDENPTRDGDSDSRTYFSPAFTPDSPTTLNPNIQSLEYQSLRQQYQSVTRKNQLIQTVGTIFTVITLFIEYFIYHLAKRLNSLVDRIHILRFAGIFGILFFISVLAIIQLVVIHKWNTQVNVQTRKTSKALNQTQISLTRSQYHIIEQIKFIQFLIILTLILSAIFFILYRNYIVIPINTRFPAVFRLYRTLLRLSAFLCLIYTVFEIAQLRVWTKRLKIINRIENRIVEEIPELDELTRILKDN